VEISAPAGITGVMNQRANKEREPLAGSLLVARRDAVH